MITYKQALQKGLQKSVRSKPYLNYVASLPCVVCQQEPAGDPHHLKGDGFGGTTKASDLLSMPLCRVHHDELHHDIDAFEQKYGSQWMWVCMTIHQAVTEGVLDL